MGREFVHLHNHSHYSMLDGACRLKDMVARAAEFGMKALAVTDHGNMFGAIEFYKRATKAGVKPILGIEAYVGDGHRSEKTKGAYHVILLARNLAGYKNLCRLSSIAFMEGLHYGAPRMDLDLIKAHNEGLIATSACLGGQLAQAAMAGKQDYLEHLALKYRDTFEEDSFFLEVQPNGLEDQLKVNAAWRALGKKLDIPLVATNDSHYLDSRDAKAQEVFIAAKTGKTLADEKRLKHDIDEYWFKPGDVMWDQLGSDFGDALENAIRISEMCNVELDLKSIYLPTYEVPEQHDTDSFLVECAQKGLVERFAEFDAVHKVVDKPLYQRRLDEELGIIETMGFPGYFLIVQDFINWAKDHGIPVGPGRGSGAGSLVAYALRITDIDPIPYGLLFERFLNPERVSMPDFDIDFCMNRRGEVIDYVTQKYGEENVGQIATFGTFKAKGAIKAVGRVMGLPYGETDKLAKMVPDVLNITLEQSLEQEPRLAKLRDEDPQIGELVDLALAMEGLHNAVGMHAAGIVIGDKPLQEYCPIFKGQNDERVTQYAKDEVEEAGLVKFDFLGLKTLTVIDDAVKMVNRGRPPEEQLDLATLGLDDEATYKLISRADTDGVFQLESSGFQELLKKLRPDKFEDIVAAVALYRPGPLNSGMLDDFINRKHGRQRVEYPHPMLSEVLEETYGVIVYQEQVMQIAQRMAGFSLGGADLLRRAMGKKKADVMAQQRIVFVDGAAERGIDEHTATTIFDLMEQFAAYGFNKSHSAAYALLTYQTAYLKCHHEVEFMAALMTSDKDNNDKVTKAIRNARDMGIEVLPPSVNLSMEDFDAVEGKILFGLGGVKGVGSTAITSIVEQREKDGPYDGLMDFCERVDLKKVNKKTIDALVKSGAFDFSGHPRARLCAALEVAVDRAQQAQRDRESGQSNLFDLLAGPPAPAASNNGGGTDLPREFLSVDEWPERQLLTNEKASLGFYVSGHPLDRFLEEIDRYGVTPIEKLGRLENNTTVTLAGIQSSYRVRPFKSGNGRMAIVGFEDRTGSVEVLAMGDELDEYEEELSGDDALLIRGRLRVERDEDGTKISVRIGGRGPRGRPSGNDDGGGPPVVTLTEVRATRSNGLQVEVPITAVTRERLEKLRDLLADDQHAGQCAPFLKISTENDCDVLIKVKGRMVDPGDALQHAISRVFGGEGRVRTV